MSVDPSDDCTFWYTNQYQAATGSFNWSTRIGTFKLPGCGGPTAPGSPTSLSATAGNAAVDLSWTPPSSNGGSGITNYKIYRGTTSGSETLVATIGNVTTYHDASVTNGITYYYKVTAVNGVGEGGLSNEASATPSGGPTKPGAPVLSASPALGRGVQLSWTAPSDGGSSISGYRIYRSTSPGGEQLLVSVGNVLSLKDTATLRGQTYYYQVTAVNSVGEGLRSNEVHAVST
jgi:fibronectin type 3 domain-containing protein